jgi:hypothetical protein
MRRTGELSAARPRERGGARLNFLLVMVGVALLAFVGWQYVPARYGAWAFEQVMQETVETAMATGKTPAWAEQQLRQNFEAYRVPEDATVEVAREGRRLRATVRYTLPLSLLVTEYDYEVDMTVRSVTTSDGNL